VNALAPLNLLTEMQPLLLPLQTATLLPTEEATENQLRQKTVELVETPAKME